MTADEKALCEKLIWIGELGSDEQKTAHDSEALIRRQAEEIDKLATALVEFNIVVGAGITLKHLERLREDHAAALAIAKERA